MGEHAAVPTVLMKVNWIQLTSYWCWDSSVSACGEEQIVGSFHTVNETKKHKQNLCFLIQAEEYDLRAVKEMFTSVLGLQLRTVDCFQVSSWGLLPISSW